MRALFLLTITLSFCIASITCQVVWNDPPFEDANVDGITIERIDAQRWGLSMNENIPALINAVIINYSGTETPIITTFDVGFSSSLEPIFVKTTSGKWAVQFQIMQDYENPSQRLYRFRINILEESYYLSIAVVNLFDEDPIVTYDGPCHAPELEVDFEMECTFTVESPDGIEGNDLRLEISDANAKDLFAFRRGDCSGYRCLFKMFVTTIIRYEEGAIYTFETLAFDIADNGGRLRTIVEIEDMPSLPPMWVTPFATARINEKEETSFIVKAIDGDTGINTAIEYAIRFAEGNERYASYFSIGQVSGVLLVAAINRDEEQIENYEFFLRAYKANDPTSSIEAQAVIIVDDINDNFPEIYLAPRTLSILETTVLNLELNEYYIEDIDLGIHATYTIALTQPTVEGNANPYASAFTIIPSSGYQKTTFNISVVNPALLDYEEPEWQDFSITIVATETENLEHTRSASLSIHLINRNDELPIFERNEYVALVDETIGENELIDLCTATDRDIDDSVVYEIMGFSDLRINNNGEVYTIVNNTFDYERQKTVFVQIKATDTLGPVADHHSVYTQLVIEVQDINDETPEIRMPRVTPDVDENSPSGTVVTELIMATDPDTTADLKFSIDWENSYATKYGQDAERETFVGCFLIEEHPETINRVYGHLIINPNFVGQVDYEMYEIIYLTIIVTDLNQVVNDDSSEGTLTIRINDLNDNSPQFIGDTLLTERSVIEETDGGRIVGTIYASDLDGPQFNTISFQIVATNNTPDDWLAIDSAKGEISVRLDAVIECDVPPFEYLYYDVIISDGELVTVGSIEIYIVDTNNKYPQIGAFDSVIEIYENETSGKQITFVVATDADRDSPHNDLQYLINSAQFPLLQRYFDIDQETGELFVNLQSNAVLDRDYGEKSFDIHLSILDNYKGNGRPNENTTVVYLTLLDVNDQHPTMPTPLSFQPEVSEDAGVGTEFGIDFEAPDADDPATPNAAVGYQILDITPLADNAEGLLATDYSVMFDIEIQNPNIGKLVTNRLLRGLYGDWSVTIEAFDHGHTFTSQIQLRSTEVYTITVNPYNYESPEILFPSNEKAYRLSHNDQELGRPIIMTDKSELPLFSAKDEDGGVYGEISFKIEDGIQGSGHSGFFDIIPVGRQTARLVLLRTPSTQTYSIQVEACDGGNRCSAKLMNVNLMFIDMQGDPIFTPANFETDFTENEEGLLETRQIPAAEDPKCDDADVCTINYFLDETYNAEDAKFFQIEGRTLSLREELDREDVEEHNIRIIASNGVVLPTRPDETSLLYVKIRVNDVNDNPPAFVSQSYGAGITPNDYKEKRLQTFLALDPDLDDVVRYRIQQGSMITNGEHIASLVNASPFVLNESTGELLLNFVVTTDMKGYFEFIVEAYDLVEHTDTVKSKIYIIAESNRVSFVMLNTREEIENNSLFITDTLTDLYEYECNLDDIAAGSTRQTEIDDETMTTMRVHFIKDNEAIDAITILSRNDYLFITKLKSRLLENQVALIDVASDSYTADVDNSEQVLRIILIVVAAMLAVLCLGLMILYLIKTHRLKRQLRALSATDFGSNASNLNRREAPTTNVFSVEGSNPVLNKNDINNMRFDEISEHSYDSDFVGIDNDPTFKTADSLSNISENEKENYKNSYNLNKNNEKYIFNKDYDQDVSRF